MTLADLPAQNGKLAVVTGGNTGLGFSTALGLARLGATVIVAARSEANGTAAAARINNAVGAPRAASRQIDLSRYGSIRRFASELATLETKVDILVNNAGVMLPPPTRTDAGFELQFGVNHLGHFLLTGLLFGQERLADDARIVTVSSLGHWAGTIDFENLQLEKRYVASREYNQSKLANLMFAFELDRRLRAVGSRRSSLAVHPGVSTTELGRHNRLIGLFMRIGNDADVGAMSSIMAAAVPRCPSGAYLGPRHLFGMRGPPGFANYSGKAKDEQIASRLWRLSEDVTGVRFPAG